MFRGSPKILIYLLMTVLALHCSTWALSSCDERASHCSGFSHCRAWALEHTGFSSCTFWVYLHHDMRNLSGPGMEVMSLDWENLCLKIVYTKSLHKSAMCNSAASRALCSPITYTLTLLLSRVRLLATTWTLACETPLSMGFSRQENWIGLPCPPSR